MTRRDPYRTNKARRGRRAADDERIGRDLQAAVRRLRAADPAAIDLGAVEPDGDAAPSPTTLF